VSPIGDLLPIEPEREGMPWRLRSWWCAAADVIGVAAGISLYAVVGIDSVVSWPSNRVLISDPKLSSIAEVLLLPTWLWVLLSAGMVPEKVRYWSPWKMPVRSRICFGAAAAVCAVVIFGGFAVGGAKGDVRILPGPRYQVSINDGAWTTVTLSQFHYWQACFVREDAFFMLFGLAAATLLIATLYLRREAPSDRA
jgi:hypothetical protein